LIISETYSQFDARLAMFLSIVVEALVNNDSQKVQYSFYCFLATQTVKSNNTEFNNQTVQHKYRLFINDRTRKVDKEANKMLKGYLLT
jgi:hypothetical protein